ncbi:MAG: hypothetical protein NW224_28450 [Leptolyngbyaceae cyanobacterium bins.302]|nr:hypothetical protein [Leptolyngbyaceae cyanobacterium bins.302]
MLQDTSTDSVLSASTAEETNPSPPTRSPEAQQFSANTYAERLMDDLFQDVEQLLDVKPSNLAEPIAQTPIATAETATAGGLQPFPETEVQEPSQPGMPLVPRLANLELRSLSAFNEHSLATPLPDALMPDADILTTAPPSTPKKINYLLMAISCLSVGTALGLWWLYQDGRQRQPSAIVPPTPDSASADSVGNQHFAAYLQKSLQNIQQQDQSAIATGATATNAASHAGMPTVVIPKTGIPAPVSNQPATGSGRVYVPVYQLPPNLYPPGTPVSPLPNVPKPGVPGSTKGSPGVAASTPTGVSRKLVGVLDQGNNSVALFEINGITQRYEMGESIGSSGWTLVEVTKNQAIIRRNGDVRSLFVGNNF